MKRRPVTVIPALLALAAACAGEPPAERPAGAAGPAPGSAEWKIANAESAAPPAVSRAATIMDWPATPDGQATQLRAGSNGWVCFADNTQTPRNDPMCFDPMFQRWADAWMRHQTPNITGLGLAYMLQGGSDASNTDPFKMAPDSGHPWVDSGPHVMIVVPNVAGLAGLPTDPASGGPWIMWQNTPYAHVMMPVHPQ
jgi:hypothetical protein